MLDGAGKNVTKMTFFFKSRVLSLYHSDSCATSWYSLELLEHSVLVLTLTLYRRIKHGMSTFSDTLPENKRPSFHRFPPPVCLFFPARSFTPKIEKYKKVLTIQTLTEVYFINTILVNKYISISHSHHS